MQVTSPSTWHHVPTAANPADCASRGIMPQELLYHPLWWEGPPWLKEDPIPMPKQPPRKELLEPSHSLNILTQQSTLAEDICSRTTDYTSNISTTAWCLRFCLKLLHRTTADSLATRDPGPMLGELSLPNKPIVPILSGAERKSAELWLLKQYQIRLFSAERTALLKGKPLSRSSKLKALHPMLDSNQLLRVGGRLENSSLSYSQQHPIIADARDPLIHNLFNHLHKALCLVDHPHYSVLQVPDSMCWVPDASAGLSALSASPAKEDSPTCSTNSWDNYQLPESTLPFHSPILDWTLLVLSRLRKDIQEGQCS